MRIFSSQQKHQWTVDVIVIGVAAAFAVLPILAFGIASGNDLPHHYHLAQSFYASAEKGVIYPSWAGAANYGFGDVGVRFYPPLSYYVLGAFYWIAGSWYYASIVAFWFWFFIGGVGVYFWAREFFGRHASVAAAVVYTFAPYHVNQIYNAFTYAEFAAAGVLPFCFLFASRLCRKNHPVNVAALGIAYTLLILTHLPMAVMGSIGLLVYSLASLPSSERLKTVGRLAVSVLSGLAASSFYWVRMVTELSYLNHATEEFTSDDYDYRSNFLASFFTSSGTDYIDRSLWFGDLVLLVTLGMIVPAAVAYYLNRRRSEIGLLGNVAVVIVSLLMATPATSFIWNNIELLQKIQFPWRWLGPMTLAGMIFVAAGYEEILARFRSQSTRPFAIIALGLAVIGVAFTAMQIIRPAVYIERSAFETKIASIANNPSCECWWPVWADKSSFGERGPITVPGREGQVISSDGRMWIFRVGPGAEAAARISLFYYPRWHATVNGINAEVSPDANGAINVVIPEGESALHLEFIETNQMKAATVLSLFTWLGLTGSLVFGLIRRFKPQDCESE